VVSYYAPSGHYSDAGGFFASAVTNGPLTAPAGAGVYLYGASGYPSNTWQNTNYYVDVVFTAP
jgi:hypothetical protein